MNELKNDTDKLLQQMVNKLDGINNTINQKFNQYDNKIDDLNNRMEYFEKRKPLEDFQQKLIKKIANQEVRSVLGPHYGDDSKRQIAYAMFYRRLEPFGYVSMKSTQVQYWDSIKEALQTQSIALDMVLKRYKEIQKEKRIAGNLQ